jgi:Family of unknown function (DUF6594)
VKDPAPTSLKSQTWHFIRSFLWPVKKEKLEVDLIVPRSRSREDHLARWVANEFVPLWQCLKDERRSKANILTQNITKTSLWQWFQKQRWSGVEASVDLEKAKTPETNSTTAESETRTINRYSGKRIVRFTAFVSTVAACLLPTVAIAVLAQLNTTAQLLGVIAVFTAVFAAGLMMLVEAGTSRVEIFAATAA